MATKTAVSEEEYLRTSFPDLDREFRDGEILERSLPTYTHGSNQMNWGSIFRPLRESHSLFPASELRLRLRPGRVVIADVAVFWPAEPAFSPPEAPPLIVIEILSPDDRMSDVRDKLQEYLDWGVRHIWLTDPHARALYVFGGDGLHEVTSYHVPEVALEVTRANIFD